MSEARLEPAPLLRVGDMLIDRGAQLRERGLRLLLLEDPGTHPHHLSERPVRHPVPVREAATPVPPEGIRQPVDVLLELPGESRLADAGDPHHRDELRLPFLGAGVKELLDEPQLAVASDEGRLEPDRLLRTAPGGGDAERAVERNRLRLSLQLVLHGGLVRDRGLGRPPRRRADEDGTRLGRGLDARGRVDQVAGDHPLPLGADRDRGLAGQHSRPDGQARIELGHGRDEVESGPHRPFGVVLVRDRRPPDGHHRVADELLDRPAVQRDQPPAGLEVAGEHLPGVLGVAALGRGGEADEIREQHRDELALRGRRRGGGDRRRAAVQRVPALVAEASLP